VPSIENDSEWRTWKRVLPLDVYEELKRFEELVATHSGLPPRYEGIGPSVSVWSVITQLLRTYEAELMILAQEWKGEQDSGPAAR
jgi:hypothetical protein